MNRIKSGVERSFNRLNKASIDGVLEISISEIKEQGVINAASPLVHLKKLKDAGWIDFETNKSGAKKPLLIKILRSKYD